MSRPARLVILMMALALTLSAQSCASGETVNPTPASGTGSARATSTPTVCTGVKGCTQVASVDIDGDGRADQVGVATHRLANNGSIVVRVRTATGHTLQTTGRHVYWFGHPFFGAVPFDGRKGAEIFVGDSMGANFEQFRVITYRAGKLVTLKAPPLVWTKKGMAKATSRWGIDGAYSVNVGVKRAVSAQGVVTITMKSAERNASGVGHTGHTNVFRWHSGHWNKVSARTVHYSSDAKVLKIGGWQVSGLRHYA